MKIYMAGPLFTTAERDFNAALAALLRALGHVVFLPQETEQTPPVTGAGIFKQDCDGIMESEVIVANMDGPDPDSGTCWECGAAYAAEAPVIVYRTDIRDNDHPFPPFNLMIKESAAIVLDCKWKTVPEIAAQIHAALLTIQIP